MRILFNDVAQRTALPESLKTGALADRYYFPTGQHTLNISFDTPEFIDCVGIGYTDGSFFRFSLSGFDGWALDGANAKTNINDYVYIFDGGDAYEKDWRYLMSERYGNWHSAYEQIVYYRDNGLYRLDRPVITQGVAIETDATFIGRLGMGRGVKLGTSIPKEPSYKYSEKTRLTLSGQVIPGIGGYPYRAVSLDTRYKIGAEEMSDIVAAYNSQTGPGLPFFTLFEEEIRRLPFIRLYVKDTKNEAFSFESGLHDRYLFSRKFEFEECF